MMGQEYLTDYEKRCLTDSAEVIQKNYPLLSLNQIRNDIEDMKLIATPLEHAKFCKFLLKIRRIIYFF